MQKKVVALGFFDGVHLGHGALLKRTKELADEKNLISAALLFDRHPLSVVSSMGVSLINTTKERAHLMRTIYRIDEMLPLVFNSECAALPWEKFLDDILVSKFNATHFVAGFDFRFGYKGEGNGAKLAEYCASRGIGCDIVERVTLGDETVSSSHIRTLLEKGDVKGAAKFLGHNHFMHARVEHGAALGRTLGTPTINQYFDKNACIPLFGVYLTLVHVEGKVFRGVTNVGIRPSVENDNIPRAETYIIGYDGDLYGKTVDLEFVELLRTEKRFNSLDELKKAIASDIEKANSM